MLKKLSLKVKLIIFAILCVIVFGIAYKEAVGNRKNITKVTTDEKVKAKEITDAQIKKAEEDKKKAAEEAEKEKQKKLEEKYQEAYKTFHSKNYWDAIKVADEIIKEDDKFYKAYNIKGIALCYAGAGSYAEGMKSIDKALELKPEDGYARFNRALALELYGHYDEALAAYDKALEVENYVWSYYGKASIYGRKGDVKNTIENLKKAIEVDASTAQGVKDAAKDEEDFNNVRSSKEFNDLLK
jgi:tetratricopeptide (TPR) repeat protein